MCPPLSVWTQKVGTLLSTEDTCVLVGNAVFGVIQCCSSSVPREKMRLILGMCKRVAHNNILSWVGRCVSIFMHRSEEEEEGGHHKPSHGHQAPALSCQASVLQLVQVHCSSSSGHPFICSVDGCMESFHLVFRCSVEVSR